MDSLGNLRHFVRSFNSHRVNTRHTSPGFSSQEAED